MNSRRSSVKQQQQQQQQRGAARRSSIAFGRGASQHRVDPRPINDKAFQIQCMRTLVDYLTTHAYPFPISPKLLPSAKEIRDMIDFLFTQFDPATPKLGKLEDDVPFFFKMIGYPFTISKSALYAAGSPHSWPGLLAALTWLVQLLNYQEAALQTQPQTTSDYMEYISSSYRAFMTGDDDACEAIDDDMRRRFAEGGEKVAKQVEETKQQLQMWKNKLEMLRKEPSPLEAREKTKQDLLTDIGKYESILTNLRSHRTSSEKKLEERTQELESRQSDLALITAENEALKQQISVQEVSAADCERIVRETKKIDEALSCVTSSNKEIEEYNSDLEIKTFKVLSDNGIAMQNVNERFRRLKVLPHMELKFNSEVGAVEEVAGIDIKGVLKPELIEEHEAKSKELRMEISAARKELYALEDAANEKHRVCKQLVEKSKKLEISYKKKAAQLEKELSQLETERDALKDDLETEAEKIKVQEVEVDEQLKNLKTEGEQLAAAYEEKEADKLNHLKSLMEFALNHREHIQLSIERCKEKFKASQKSLKIMNDFDGNLQEH